MLLKLSCAILLLCFLSFEQSYRKLFTFLKMHTTVPALLRGTLYKHTPAYLFQAGGQNAFHQVFFLTKCYTSYINMATDMFILCLISFMLLNNLVSTQR